MVAFADLYSIYCKLMKLYEREWDRGEIKRDKERKTERERRRETERERDKERERQRERERDVEIKKLKRWEFPVLSNLDKTCQIFK